MRLPLLTLGAGLGAAAVRLPHFSPQRTPRGKHSKANRLTQKGTLLRRRPRNPVLRRDRHKEQCYPEVNLIKPDNRPTLRECTKAIPTHGGIETQPPASRPVWRSAANSRREPNIRHRNRTTSPRRPAAAHPRPCRPISGQTQPFAGAQFTIPESGISLLRASADKRPPMRSPSPNFIFRITLAGSQRGTPLRHKHAPRGKRGDCG